MRRPMLSLILLSLAVAATAQPFAGRDLCLSGDRLNLMDASGTLHIIDASDPFDLVELGSINPETEEWWIGLRVVCLGTTAYVMENNASEVQGVRISTVDAADPANPLVTDSIYYSGSGPLTGLAVDADRALLYVSKGDLSVYSLADPLHPALLDQLDLSFYRPVADIQVAGNTVYCAQGFTYFPTEEDIFGVAVVDATVPSALAELSYMPNYPTRFRSCFRVDGDLLFSIIGEELGDPTKYFQVQDISDVSTPQILAEVVAGDHGKRMRVHDDVVYFTGESGVIPVDVSDPYAPAVGQPVPGTPVALAFEISPEGVLFACWDYGFAVVDLNPTSAPPPAAPEQIDLTAWPNPFNPKVALRFTLPVATAARVSIHDAAGRRVALLAEGEFAAGPKRLDWDGRDGAGRAQPSGVYLARVETPLGACSERLVLLR